MGHGRDHHEYGIGHRCRGFLLSRFGTHALCQSIARNGNCTYSNIVHGLVGCLRQCIRLYTICVIDSHILHF